MAWGFFYLFFSSQAKWTRTILSCLFHSCKKKEQKQMLFQAEKKEYEMHLLSCPGLLGYAS